MGLARFGCASNFTKYFLCQRVLSKHPSLTHCTAYSPCGWLYRLLHVNHGAGGQAAHVHRSMYLKHHSFLTAQQSLLPSTTDYFYHCSIPRNRIKTFSPSHLSLKNNPPTEALNPNKILQCRNTQGWFTILAQRSNEVHIANFKKRERESKNKSEGPEFPNGLSSQLRVLQTPGSVGLDHLDPAVNFRLSLVSQNLHLERDEDIGGNNWETGYRWYRNVTFGLKGREKSIIYQKNVTHQPDPPPRL